MLVFSRLADEQIEKPPRTTLFSDDHDVQLYFEERVVIISPTQELRTVVSEASMTVGEALRGGSAAAQVAECPCVNNVFGDILNAQCTFSYFTISTYLAQIL